MPRRLLNIASIACLVMCVALMAMWVRSYFDGDYLCGRISPKMELIIASRSGRVQAWDQGPSDRPFLSTDDTMLLDLTTEHLSFLGFGYIWQSWPGTTVVAIPYWFLVFASGSLAMVLRMCWPPRFTLRGLFVATTFLAIVLGMIAWLDRTWIGK